MFRVGADPEIFVGDGASVRSIVGRIGGTKEFPRPLPLGDGFAVQEDNVALEFNIPASDSKEAFVGNISMAMQFLEQLVQDQHQLRFVKDSAIIFPEDELNTPESRTFGCDPDFNAWTGKRNPRPKAADWRLRSCGGHVHIGADGLTKDQKFQVAQACDLFLGVPSVLQDSGLLRKELYGAAGACRLKPYGLEYRTLSNYWVFSKELTAWVYDNAKQAYEFVINGRSLSDDADAIVHAINSNDGGLAHNLINKYNIQMA